MPTKCPFINSPLGVAYLYTKVAEILLQGDIAAKNLTCEGEDSAEEWLE